MYSKIEYRKKNLKPILQPIFLVIKSSRVFSSLESKNYRRFFVGQSISLIGSWMQSIAMSWLVYRLTGSKFLLGFVGFTSQIPSFVLSPFAGVVTDRFNRRNIMLYAQISFTIQALIFGFLSLSDLVQIWHIIALSILYGFIAAFDAPSRQSLVVDLIDNPKNLGNAIALNSAMFNGARLIGPAIAGITIALVGEGICFLINALSYVAIIIALSKIRITRRSEMSGTGSLGAQFYEGFKYTFGFKPIRVMLILLAVISLFGIPFLTLMPAYASETLHGGSHTYGFLMSATGAGALTAAIFLASRKDANGLGKIISQTTFFISISLFAFSFNKSIGFSLPIGFAAGFCTIATIASANTMIQSLAEEDKRGRVMSFYAMALMGMTPFGSLISGTIASAIGLSLTFAICGFITFLIWIWFFTLWPRMQSNVLQILEQRQS